MSGQPYLASEDSAFLREVLGHYHGDVCLEIGAGNAGNLVELGRKFVTVVGTDVVRPSMTDWKGSNVNFVLTDRASCLRDAIFDLVTFNPPYLPLRLAGDRAVEGGRGLEVPKGFLEDALRVAKRRGNVVMLLNGDADPEQFRLSCERNGFSLRKVATRHLFFEELSVYQASSSTEAP